METWPQGMSVTRAEATSKTRRTKQFPENERTFFKLCLITPFGTRQHFMFTEGIDFKTQCQRQYLGWNNTDRQRGWQTQKQG